MKKVTYRASSDVALIKYWGKKDDVLRLPENGSVSLILEGLETVTTAEFGEQYEGDWVTINGEVEGGEKERVVKHLDRIRNLAHTKLRARIVSENNFPRGTGLSSSGSGFAALTYAATRALDLDLTEKEVSILARQGSGTACRCVCGGVVEWKDGPTSETSFAESLYTADYWDLRDVIVVVDEGRKRVSSSEGHTLAKTSIAFVERQRRIGKKIETLKGCLANRDFVHLGELVEREALEFHSILLTSEPPLIAWYPGTVEVMLEVQKLREEKVLAYFTINTGFNVHVLTLPEYEDRVRERLGQLPLVKKVLGARVGGKPQELTEHLF